MDRQAAFPWQHTKDCVDGESGMTHEDWLAGMAMSAMLANPKDINLDDKKVAVLAYKYADAMMQIVVKRNNAEMEKDDG